MNIDVFVGNRQVKSSLSARLRAGKLSHGILLSRDRGEGSGELAILLARDITGGDPDNRRQGLDPNITVIRGEGAGGNIKVDAVRRVTRDARYSSLTGEDRVYIFQKCEAFNPSSANALLKSLEEPAPGVTYILTSEKPRMILPTIRSRCRVYTLKNPDKEEALGYFASKGRDMDLVNSLFKVYGPSIGKIKRCLDDPERLQTLRRAQRACLAAAKGDRYGFSKACYPCLDSRDRAKILLWDITDICRRDLNPRNIKIISMCEKCEEYISRYTNLGLIFENLAAVAAGRI